MSLVHRSPWNIFDQLQHEINRSQAYNETQGSDEVVSNWAPAVDIKEEESRYLLIADVPGVNPKSIDIQMEKDTLSIKGERNSGIKSEQHNFKRIERKQGVFYRQFTLPKDVNSENIKAKCDNGVLTLSIPKQETLKPRKITVN